MPAPARPKGKSATPRAGTRASKARPQVRAATPIRGLPVGALALVIGGVALLLIGAGVLFTSLHSRTLALAGPTIQGAPPAADFTLTDQNGQRIQLSAYRGKVVAMTFLYTNCPDVCPLIASKLGQADRQLGSDQSKAVLLAVTVDPEHDTPSAVRQFDQQHSLDLANWHYLLGSTAALQPVWKSYYVGTDAAEVPGGAAVKASTPSPDLVNHTAIVYMIDPQGRLRVALDAEFTVADFVQNVRALAQGA